MHFDLWDTETSNYYGRFESEHAVLELVEQLIHRYGSDYAADLGIGRVGDQGEILEPLSGDALIARISEVLHPADEHSGVVIASAV